MPKVRPPFDMPRYETLKAQGHSQRAIAQAMGMPEATLRNNLKVLAQSAGAGTPNGDIGPPEARGAEVSPKGPLVGDQSIPLSSSVEGIPGEDPSPPPLYVHPGIPDDGEESPVGGENIAGVHDEIPALPHTGIHEDHLGPPVAGLSPELAEALTTAWPELEQMLEWWRGRQQYLQEPPKKLERVTYHVAPRWIEAVRREADLSGDSYAAVVNRAFAQYFAGKST